MDTFHQNESHMRHALQETFKGLFPVQRFEEMGKQNMVLFENMAAAARKNGAVIHLESPVGAGTVVRIEIPVAT